MKTIYIAIVAALVLAACSDDSDNSTTVNVNGKKLKRNTEINKTNAYNDLFSTAPASKILLPNNN